jgi:formylmethanofuran dehydrogenase subunit E
MPPFLTTDCSYCYRPAISAIRCADCGEAICDDCREEFARLCDGCGELVCNEHLKMLNGSLLCEKCRAAKSAGPTRRPKNKLLQGRFLIESG